MQQAGEGGEHGGLGWGVAGRRGENSQCAGSGLGLMRRLDQDGASPTPISCWYLGAPGHAFALTTN